MSKTALIIIADGTEEIEAIAPGDVLNRCGVNVTYAGVGTIYPTGGHGVPLRAEMLVEEVGEILFDVVILPGGGKGAENLHKSEIVTEIIMRHHGAGKIIAAICASPAVVLAPLGLLHGKHATCFPGLEKRFFTSDIHHASAAVVVDGRVVTSRGPGTAMEFSVKLGELLSGAATALKVGQSMLLQAHEAARIGH